MFIWDTVLNAKAAALQWPPHPVKWSKASVSAIASHSISDRLLISRQYEHCAHSRLEMGLNGDAMADMGYMSRVIY